MIRYEWGEISFKQARGVVVQEVASHTHDSPHTLRVLLISIREHLNYNSYYQGGHLLFSVRYLPADRTGSRLIVRSPRLPEPYLLPYCLD